MWGVGVCLYVCVLRSECCVFGVGVCVYISVSCYKGTITFSGLRIDNSGQQPFC